jgi:predicted nucleic acid-binding Zn ribbon protein
MLERSFDEESALFEIRFLPIYMYSARSAREEHVIIMHSLNDVIRCVCNRANVDFRTVLPFVLAWRLHTKLRVM